MITDVELPPQAKRELLGKLEHLFDGVEIAMGIHWDRVIPFVNAFLELKAFGENKARGLTVYGWIPTVTHKRGDFVAVNLYYTQGDPIYVWEYADFITSSAKLSRDWAGHNASNPHNDCIKFTEFFHPEIKPQEKKTNG